MLEQRREVHPGVDQRNGFLDWGEERRERRERNEGEGKEGERIEIVFGQ